MLRGLPLPEPRPQAVAYGVFGREETGPITPDAEQVASLVREQAFELLGVILDLHAAQEGIHSGVDPRTGRLPRTAAQRTELQRRLRDSTRRLSQSRDDLLAVYADAFGEENARLLDDYVHLWAFGRVEP